MDQRTAELLRYALTTPLGFYQQANMIVRLLAPDNVAEIMFELPVAVRDEFLEYARETYVPRGPRYAITGSTVPEANLEALRAWLAADSSFLETSPIPQQRPRPAQEYRSLFAQS